MATPSLSDVLTGVKDISSTATTVAQNYRATVDAASGQIKPVVGPAPANDPTGNATPGAPAPNGVVSWLKANPVLALVGGLAVAFIGFGVVRKLIK